MQNATLAALPDIDASTDDHELPLKFCQTSVDIILRSKTCTMNASSDFHSRQRTNLPGMKLLPDSEDSPSLEDFELMNTSPPHAQQLISLRLLSRLPSDHSFRITPSTNLPKHIYSAILSAR